MHKFLTLALLLSPLATAQEVLDEQEAELTTASEQDAKAYLARYEDAVESQDGMRVAEALAPMTAHDNPEFLEAALDSIKYRASKVDKRAAKTQAQELGTVSKKEIDGLTFLREEEVQLAAATVLANFPEGGKATKALNKAYKDKSLRKDKPRAFAAVIRSLGKLGYDKLGKDMLQLIEQSPSKEVAGAAVRYFGQIKTRDYSTVRKLAQMLTGPAPAAVNSATNPPAGYWAAKWEVWSWTRRDVTWSLKQITGQTFRPEEGDHSGDTKKALDYIKANKRELGLR